LRYSLGGRDALILALYLLSGEAKSFVTQDASLLPREEVELGKRSLEMVSFSD